ncbi:MAG: hypothetical protein F4152_05655, partial [Dehalococcoidia bacterium]|nr:hypothetical protein [Dehalococcoidia bacterium]
MKGLLKAIVVLAAVGAVGAVVWRLLARRRELESGDATAAEFEFDGEIDGETRLRTAASYLDEGNVYFNVGQYALAIERY